MRLLEVSGLLRRYVPGPGTDQPIAMITPAGAGQTRSYFHVNRQGSTVALSNDAGTVSEGPYTYDAYGQGASSAGVPFKYTGRRLDPETGLYYYRARYYSASLGRFLQTDPIGYADQMNLYGYVGNDPVNFIDPLGEAKYTVGFDATVVKYFGWKAGLEVSFDDETLEVSGKAVGGARVGAKAGVGLKFTVEDSSTEPAKNGIEAKVDMNFEGNLGPASIKQSLVSVDKDGVKVLEGDKEGGKAKVGGKFDLKLGVSAGVDVEVKASTSIVKDGYDASKEIVNSVGNCIMYADCFGL